MSKKNKELRIASFDRDEDDGYFEWVHCQNCNWRDVICFPFGEQVKTHLKDKECLTCKCVGTLY